MTLSCAETEARLVDVIDGRLDAPVEMRVHAHLEGCAACRQKAELWRRVVPGMRALAPTPPAELGARRLQVEILKRLQSSPEPRARAPRRGLRVAGALALLGAVAALTIIWRQPRTEPRASAPAVAPARFATVTRTLGQVRVEGRPLAPSAALPAGTVLEVGGAGETELSMDRGSTLRLRGPARLTLAGTAGQAALRLEEGTLEAQVAHRLAGETFSVSTRDARVEVRGTHFIVRAGAAGSWVQVVEGVVAVQLADGSSRLVRAGEIVTTAPAGEAPPAPAGEMPPAPAGETPPAPAGEAPPAPPSCSSAVRSCRSAARGARQSMRGGDNDRALGLVSGASRSARQTGPSCASEIAACEDELGYLRAEALRAAGRIDDAVGAYRALNRPGAPAAMRQNALYAAAELERRRGRTREAGTDYESALSVAPRGVLREEALVGAMESAAELGERARASAFARRYLAEFPDGRAAPAARRLAGEAPHP